MTRTRLVCSMAAAIAVWPAVAAAQGAQAGPDPRVRVAPRVVEQQRQVERERARERAQEARREQTETMSRTFQIGRTGEIVVNSMAGDVTVTRARGNEALIEATKVARGRTDEEAKQMLALVKVDFVERGNRVEAQSTFQRQAGRMSVSVTYNISAPAGTRVSVRVLAGDIRVSDISGEVSAESLSGDITIANGQRVVAARSKSGDVEITNTTSDIGLEADSVSGDVVLRQVKAPRLRVNSISGELVLMDVQAERVEAQSVSGDVGFTGPVAQGGRYQFGSHAGNVQVTTVGNTGFELEANTFSGSIRTDPRLGVKRDNNAKENDRHGHRSVRAVVGDGAARLEITTFSGDVLVSRK